MQDLGTLRGDEFSEAFGINNAGQVVGGSGSFSGPGRAFLWTTVAGMQDIGPGGASDINDAGQVVGASVRGAFLWSAAAGMQDLGVLPGMEFSAATGINNAGQVVGESSELEGFAESRAFRWTAADGMQDLNALIDPLDPLKAVTTLFDARDINNAGQIVGSGVINGRFHGYLLTPVPEPETWALLLVGLGMIRFLVRKRSRSAT